MRLSLEIMFRKHLAAHEPGYYEYQIQNFEVENDSKTRTYARTSKETETFELNIGSLFSFGHL